MSKFFKRLRQRLIDVFWLPDIPMPARLMVWFMYASGTFSIVCIWAFVGWVCGLVFAVLWAAYVLSLPGPARPAVVAEPLLPVTDENGFALFLTEASDVVNQCWVRRGGKPLSDRDRLYVEDAVASVLPPRTDALEQ